MQGLFMIAVPRLPRILPAFFLSHVAHRSATVSSVETTVVGAPVVPAPLTRTAMLLGCVRPGAPLSATGNNAAVMVAVEAVVTARWA